MKVSGVFEKIGDREEKMKSNYQTIKVELKDGVAVFTMDNPPVNQLSKLTQMMKSKRLF
jgi:UDP-N-acetylmuramyl tripeptide synthase